MADFVNLDQIANLNPQGIQIAHSIDAHIGKLAEDPDTRKLAEALKGLTQAIVGAEAALADAQRREGLEQLELLSEQARVPAEQRKLGIIRRAIDTLAGVCAGSGGLAAVWTIWGSAITGFFMENLRDLRVQFMLSPQKLAEVEDLMRECGVKTKQELFNNALTLLQWVVGQVQSGRSIASMDEREKRYRELQMPILTAAAKAGAPRTREHVETRRRNRARATHTRAEDN